MFNVRSRLPDGGQAKRKNPLLKIVLLFFFLSTLYLLLSTFSIASADWYEESWGETQESELSNYYCEQGIKFYREGEYEQAREAFEKALLIDSECELAREYLKKLQATGYKLEAQKTEDLSSVALAKEARKPLTEIKEDEIEREIRRVEREIEKLRVEEEKKNRGVGGV